MSVNITSKERRKVKKFVDNRYGLTSLMMCIKSKKRYYLNAEDMKELSEEFKDTTGLSIQIPLQDLIQIGILEKKSEEYLVTALGKEMLKEW